MAKTKISPVGSSAGYSFWQYVLLNKEMIKAVGSAGLALLLAVLGYYKVDVPASILAAATPFVTLLFHSIISAIEYRYSRVELE